MDDVRPYKERHQRPGSARAPQPVRAPGEKKVSFGRSNSGVGMNNCAKP